MITNSKDYLQYRPFLQEKLDVKDERIAEKIWNQAHFCQRLPSTDLESGLRETLVYSGPGIPVGAPSADLRIHSLMNYLLGRGEAIPAQTITKEHRQAILFGDNKKVLARMREEVRSVLQSCIERLPPKNEAEEKLVEAFIGNILALIPYTYPQEGESFQIPLKIQGQWQAVSYTVDKEIELTPRALGSPIVAYGMTSPQGPPLLLFLGTTFPSGKGFFSTLAADFTFGMSVGHAPYLMGRHKIQQWMDGKEGVQLYGSSLGGAFAFHTLLEHQSKVARVDVYNPAGLYARNWKRARFDSGTDVRVYYQENDLVATMGYFPVGKNVSVYRVLREQPENFLKAHSRIYAGGETVTILKSDAERENHRIERKLLTFLHSLAGFLFAPLVLACLLIRTLFSLLADAAAVCFTPKHPSRESVPVNISKLTAAKI